jgi:hypothetical protein
MIAADEVVPPLFFIAVNCGTDEDVIDQALTVHSM